MVVTPGRATWRRVRQRARTTTAVELTRRGGCLVLAPHPDDETLGAGGLIAALASAGREPAVAFLTDGSGSHVGAPGWSPGRVANVRASEARAALRSLGCRDEPIMLGWRDAAPHPADTPAFSRTVRQLTTLCRRRGLRTVVASWNGDPHCDHEAAAAVARTVARRLGTRPLFYCVWGWTVPDLDRRLRPMRAISIPTARWRGHQRRALAQHRTQLGGRIAAARDRFVLPRTMRRLVDASHLILLEQARAT